MAGLGPPVDQRSWPPLRPGGAGDDAEQANELMPWVSGNGWQPSGDSLGSGYSYADSGAGEEEYPSRKGGKNGFKGKGGKGGKRKKGGKWAGKGSIREEGEEDEGGFDGSWEGRWDEGGWWAASGRRGAKGGGYSRSQASSGLIASDLLGDWLDAQDNDVTVLSSPDRRGPLTAKLARKGGREQVLSVRREPESGCWACGNAVLDRAASSANVLVWAAYDGRRSVWRRREAAAEAEPEDLLPWLLKPLALQGRAKGGQKGKTQWEECSTSKDREAKDAAAGGSSGSFVPPASKPRLRRRNWSSISMDSDCAGVFIGSLADKVEEKDEDGSDGGEQAQASAAERCSDEAEGQQETVSSSSKIPVNFEAESAAADVARVCAVLDARQVLGTASNHQEILSYILLDHDLLKGEGEDAMVPGIKSPLWERLPEVPRRNVLHRLSNFHTGSFVAGSLTAEFPAGSWSEVHLGRHRFQVAQTDVQALLKRCTLPEEESAARATAMARVLALYRALENPLLPTGQRSSHQLSPWGPLMKMTGIEYELFASPFNAKVANGKFASRFPHIERLFGSAGSYPDVIDLWPETAVVAVNPPFSDAYLEHVVGQNLERLVGRFKKVHTFFPVRDASWRPQLRRLKGASFVQRFWDSTALQERYLEQPVLHWEGSELAAADS
eukprot:TRINITY_DN33140_c0_g1_i1.p1 TRINITY_DN33140_c0_g1~~TRINITY_DN33140_c0_g1_i1.p1  ORF type:complete len:668 (+),score=154.88 TRINITY_DN33140_c0_g1_i1:103-2106(+)